MLSHPSQEGGSAGSVGKVAYSRLHIKGGESRPGLLNSDLTPTHPASRFILGTSKIRMHPGQKNCFLPIDHALLHAPSCPSAHQAHSSSPSAVTLHQFMLGLSLPPTPVRSIISTAWTLVWVATPSPPDPLTQTFVLVGLKEGPFPELGLTPNQACRHLVAASPGSGARP